MIKKLQLSQMALFVALLLLPILPCTAQIEPINMGQTFAFSEYVESLGEFSPKNHPGSGAASQIMWKSGDNIYLYGNADINFEYGTSAFWVYNMTIRQWKCLQPKNTVVNYGTKGVFSETNSPGTRVKSVAFTDSSGNLFLFGGSSFNDLWKYDIALGQWAWIGGYNSADGLYGNAGPIGAESPLYFPSSRETFKPILAPDGRIYLYGGYAETWNGYTRSDLWRYDPATNSWARLYNRIVPENDLNDGQNIAAMNVESPDNHPGRLFNYTSWFYDNSLWLFGGSISGSTGTDNYYKQVWKYNLSTGLWSCTKNPAGIDAVYGQAGIADPDNTPPLLVDMSNAVTIGDEAFFVGGFEPGGNTSDNLNRGLHNSLWKFNMTTNTWTWMKGSTKTFHPGFYGKKGVERDENMLASRRNTLLWLDNGAIKSFGGKTYRGNTFEFWNYDPGTNDFTWVDGKSRTFQKYVFAEDDSYVDDAETPSVYNKLACSEMQWGSKGEKLWVMLNASGMWEYDLATSTNHLLIPYGTGNGNYGQQGVAAPENIPPFRANALLWETDTKLYLMGGGTSFYYNDFWSFDKATKMWTWVSGAQNNATPYFQYGAIGEANAANYPKSRSKSQTWVDGNQNLWLFSGGDLGGYLNDFWKYDMNTGIWILMGGGAANTQFNATYFIDSYPSFVSNAACWTAGNHLYFYGGTGISRSQTTMTLSSGTLSDVWKYSIDSNAWTRVSGNRKKDNPANYGIQQYGFTSNLPGARTKKMYWSDEYGNFWMYGGFGKGETGTTDAYLFDLWKYDISLNVWIWMDGPKNPLFQFDDALNAYNWNLPVILYDDCRVFYGNGKHYMFIRETRSSLWEVDIATYPGDYNTIEGTARYDAGADCDASDIAVPNLKLGINGTEAQFYTNLSGYYRVYTPELNNTLENLGLVQNSSLFTVTPAAHNVNFAGYNNVEVRDFCVSPNGSGADLDITVIPLNEARPGNDAIYKVVYRNKGNVTLSGSIAFSFNDALQDYVSSTVTPNSQSAGEITWNYTNLAPFESRNVQVILNTNTSTESPAVNAGDVLQLTAVVNPIADDVTIPDNTFVLSQGVVNSLDPNDKSCLQGTVISEDMVGEYLSYLIRFENMGNAAAQNVAITDVIDADKYDIGSIEVIDSSHSYRMTVTDGTRVDFIFENIYLPFANATNDGYIAFRIRTLQSLEAGDTVSNSADIYFDFNAPIETNTFVTTIEGDLGAPDLQTADLTVYPNPVKSELYFKGESVPKIGVYDMTGRVLLTIDVNGNKADLSQLPRGIYVVRTFGKSGNSYRVAKE